MSLIIGTGPGNDSKMSDEKLKAYKHFANKIWNISRFVFENTQEEKRLENFKDYTEADEILNKEQQELFADVTKDLEEFRFYLAGEKLYHYAWHRFADIILEDSKKIFESGDVKKVTSRKQFLLHSLRKIIISLHPFMPYITEEIWSTIPDSKNLLIIEPWIIK